jgi:hypothetical protein
MTVAHKNLTGVDLHEPKGVAAAAANKVYVSDGAGSGAWTATSTFNPFSNALLHVRDEKPSGTSGGTFTSGSYQTRTLNTTKTNEISGASLASNQITLPAGTYWCEASAMASLVNTHKAKLYNVTDASDILIGTSGYNSQTAAYAYDRSFVTGRFTLAASKVIELRHRCSVTRATDGFGVAVSFGDVEVYAEAMIWKIA